MPPKDPVVVRTASTPSQAKVFVTLLQAEGIPAYIEGDSLTDEFAASQRLMNLLGVKVLVPASELARAAEILAVVELPEGELEAQALAAAPEIAAADAARLAVPPPAVQKPSRFWLLLAVGSMALAILFFALWQHERERYQSTYEWYHDLAIAGDSGAGKKSPWLTEPIADGFSTHLRSDGRLAREAFDRNHNGWSEEYRHYDRSGNLTLVMRDVDEDGIFEQLEEFRGGLHLVLHSSTGDDNFDSFTLFDKDGKELKRQRWSGADGYVDVPRPR